MKEKIKFIKELAKSINTYNLDEISYENEEFSIDLVKRKKDKRSNAVYSQPVETVITQQAISQQKTQASISQNAPIVAAEEITGTKVESPMTGTFYAKPSPTSNPFVKEGDKVLEGQTICIVEAMKLMNEVKAPMAGTIKKTFVKDGEPIKKGQLLFVIE